MGYSRQGQFLFALVTVRLFFLMRPAFAVDRAELGAGGHTGLSGASLVSLVSYTSRATSPSMVSLFIGATFTIAPLS